MRTSVAITFFILKSLICLSQNAPASINEAIERMINKFSDSTATNFKNMVEQDAVNDFHMTIGMSIRNSWIRHGNKSLREEFNNLGIYHPDDMSAIILASAHRKLNNVQIELPTQIQYYVDYWKVVNDQAKEDTAVAVSNYNKFNIGDTITIYYPINDVAGEQAAVLYPTYEWDANTDEALKIIGTITDKYYYNSESNVFFKIKILQMNHPGLSVLGTKMNVGEEHNFSLAWLKITKAL